MANDDIEYYPLGRLDPSRVLESNREAVNKQIKCHRIGRIVAFNSDTLTCDVKLLDKMTYFGQAEDYAIIPDLPLIISGTDTKHITLGDIVGSECIVHFNDVDTDNWFETGENYIPNSSRKHSLSDGFVELRPFNKTAVFTYYASGIEIKNGNCLIHINDDGTIEITNGTSSITMNGDTVAITGKLTVSSTIVATGEITGNGIPLSTHKHTGVTTGSGKSGTPVAS